MSRIEQLAALDLFTYKPRLRSPKLMPQEVPPEVCVLFERLTLKVIDTGLPHYSAYAIMHQIRWLEQVEKGNSEFKVNNNWTPALARWFITNHPSHAKFFETRALKERADD